ncbi:SCO7613 C-terminal domain-containing membrane protein [Streptomyces sp. NPDC002888]|uniref:SCO7613 C-terminal domain-containing membrane protein n=1 Tax=Streptomyces sp. NPDC002888 TaxID=3364668 RepID=UPI0036AAA504
MTHIPPPAEELRLLDAELWQLDARRAQLLARRAWLVAHLHPPRQAPSHQPASPGPGPETSAPGVQNLLLLLGGVLLTIAAMAFTLVSWGHMGIAGRALVLGTVTAVALAAPVPLLRRGLRSTAESVAGLGIALTVLDAYALHEVALTDADGTAYAAFASAVLALLWTGYGLGLGAVTAEQPAAEPTGRPRPAGLRLPLPFALVAAQLPLPLWAIAASAGTYGVAAALLVTAGFDTAVVLLRTTAARSVRVTAAVGAYGMGGGGVLAAGWLSWTAAGPGAAARAAALLVLAAATALVAAWRLAKPETRAGHALAGGVLLVAAFGAVLSVALPGGWAVPAHLACGVALLAAIRDPLPEPVQRGLAWAAGSVQALALLWTVPLVAVALLGPVGWVERPWSGVPSDARAAVTVHAPWPPYPAQALLVLVAVAGVLALVVRNATWRPRALTGALVLACAAAVALPSALELPYLAGLSVLGTLTAAAAFTSRSLTTTLLSLIGSLNLAFLSLASQTATLAVLSALTVLFAAASWRPRVAPFTAPAAFVYATALACATGAAAGWQPQYTALLVLVVPAVAALLAARLGGSPATVPVEATGAAAGLLAVQLSVTDVPMLALVLALCGVITAGTAVRAERRPVGYTAAALFLLAAWVRLAAWDVTTPEAYTLPVTVPALLVGALRRRRDPGASSWTAYGPGLAATLVPSLVATWGDQHGTRPLLLGAAALLVTLLGARHRLRALLVLGGSVLVLDAVHELAPYLVQVADALPRWVPPALAGLLLLALGATYEQRIRDVRRVREVLGRMN